MHHGIRRPVCIVEMLGGVWVSDLVWGLGDGWKDLISSQKELLRWECHAKYPNATNYLIIQCFFVSNSRCTSDTSLPQHCDCICTAIVPSVL